MPNNHREGLEARVAARRAERERDMALELEAIEIRRRALGGERLRGENMERENSKDLSPGTFGIEIEVNNVRELIKNLPDGWKYTNDISVQSNAVMFRGKPVQVENLKYIQALHGDRIGTEIVSPIISEFTDVIDVLDNIKESGVKTNAKDCGIHIHVSFPRGDAVLPLFKLGLKYEPLFYAIGTFGGFSRGVYKDYIYQRPLLYPPIVKIAKGNGDTFFGHCFDVSKFGKVKNEKDFSKFMYASGGTKYHAAKYCAINFYSYFYRGTIEIRTFNLTTNYSYVKAAINLSRDFALAGIKEYYSRSEGEDIEINYINDMTQEDILALLDEFLSRYSTFTDEEDAYTLRLLVRNAPKIDINKKALFHLIFHRNGDNSVVHSYKDKRFLPEIVDISDAIKPKPENLNDYDFEGGVCAN